MPQWELGSAIINAASFSYSYKPENLLIDFNMGMWWTTGKYNQHNGYAEDVGAKNAGQYFHTYDDDRKGINLTNTSSLSNTPVNLTYGIEITTQKIRPLNKRYQSIWTPQATYPGDELLSAARNAQGIGKALFFNTEYDGDRFHALVGWRGHTFEINDKNQNHKIKYQERNDIF
ncbi:hypothetical protein J5069_23875, partial [Candidatus Symbiopectobacterium sp. NZEC127]|nr:hypothetical protein [Candidatus Symbiopectobacterium sp. NZEC127]